jgi:hypothetical protein
MSDDFRLVIGCELFRIDSEILMRQSSLFEFVRFLA